MYHQYTTNSQGQRIRQPSRVGSNMITPGGYSAYNASPYQTPQGTAGSGFYDPFQQFGQGVTRGHGLQQAQDWSNMQLQNLPDPNATPQGFSQWLGMSPRTGPPRSQGGQPLSLQEAGDRNTARAQRAQDYSQAPSWRQGIARMFGYNPNQQNQSMSPSPNQKGVMGQPGGQQQGGQYGMQQQGGMGQLPRPSQGYMPSMMDYANYYGGQNQGGQQQFGQMFQKDIVGGQKGMMGQQGAWGQPQPQIGDSNAFDFRNPANINRGTQAQQNAMQAYQNSPQSQQGMQQQQSQPSPGFMGNLMQSMNPQQLAQWSQSGTMPQGIQAQRPRQQNQMGRNLMGSMMLSDRNAKYDIKELR